MFASGARPIVFDRPGGRVQASVSGWSRDGLGMAPALAVAIQSDQTLASVGAAARRSAGRLFVDGIRGRRLTRSAVTIP
jgi:hypothetical protein